MFSACAKWAAGLFFALSLAAALLTAGCLTRLAVDRSSPPVVDLKNFQPAAILPPADTPGFAGSGALLLAASREALKAKNFSVTAPARADQALQEMNLSAREVSREAALLRRFGQSLRARIILVATFLDLRVQRSYVSPSTTQVWHEGAYEYQSLPTFHQGVCEMKISLKLLDAENGTAVWTAEGRGRGPSGSEAGILRQLVADLTKGLPLLPEKRE